MTLRLPWLPITLLALLASSASGCIPVDLSDLPDADDDASETVPPGDDDASSTPVDSPTPAVTPSETPPAASPTPTPTPGPSPEPSLPPSPTPTSTPPATDADADGYGPGEDCDDADAATYPGADEQCDSHDNDCDSQIDEAVGLTFYRDQDSDGYGAEEDTTVACATPAGYASEPGDCEDSDASINPGASETCNGIDEDCDGAIDEDVLPTWYADTDGDGYGTSDDTRDDCGQPSGYVDRAGDCDDDDDTMYPGAFEICDGIDQNCNGALGDDPVPYYPDGDGDGFGDGTAGSTEGCEPADGWVVDALDCDDADSLNHPMLVDQVYGSVIGDGTVYSPLATVQAGILNAEACPLVLVNPGTYLEAVIIDGRDGLTVRATAGPEETSIVSDAQLRPVTLSQVTNLTLEGFTIEAHDPVNGNGGAVRVDGSSKVVLRSLIVQNSTANGGDLIGGGISVELSYFVTLADSTLSGNSAEIGGGLAVSSSSMLVMGCAFLKNISTTVGGGIASGDLEDGDPDSMLRIEDSVFTENVAKSIGGGVYNDDKTHELVVENTLFERNAATDAYGGAIYNPTSIEHCIFVENKAVSSSLLGDGGALMMRQDATVYNSIFVGNRANYAGAIDLNQYDGEAGSYAIVNNTFVDNDGLSYPGGDSIYLYSSTFAEIRNNVFANLTSDTEYNLYRLTSGQSWKIEYNDIYQINGFAVGTSIAEERNVVGQNGNISINPPFESYVAGDFDKTNLHLKVGSGCIDAGDPAGSYKDADGTRNDMGAYGGPGSVW